jgi:hypothetical protein
MRMSISMKLAVVSLMALSVACDSLMTRSCEGPRRRLDYWTPLLSEIDRTNRLEVTRRSGERIGIVTERSGVNLAVEFLKAHPSGWRDSWNAPGVGALNLNFYEGSRRIGGYGITISDTERSASESCLISVGTLVQRIDREKCKHLQASLAIQSISHD